MPPLRVVNPELVLEGPVVDILVSVTRAWSESAADEGRELPSPVALRGLLDTGSDCCYVQTGTAGALGLLPMEICQVTTLGPPQDVTFYSMKITLLGTDGSVLGSWEGLVGEEDLTGESHSEGGCGSSHQAVIGREGLADTTFVYSGTECSFELRFD